MQTSDSDFSHSHLPLLNRAHELNFPVFTLQAQERLKTKPPLTSGDHTFFSIDQQSLPMSSSSIYSALLLWLIQTYFFCSELVNGCSVAEQRALLQFRSGLNDPENRLSSWRGSGCCSWRGVSCDNRTGSVTAIHLRNQYPNPVHGSWNLSGKIDPSLLQLKSLEHLDLSHNAFEGIPIPSFFGSLVELRYLNLSKSGFSGTVPPQLGNLPRLQYLDLSSNFPPLVVVDFQWASGLSSLEFLSMNSADLSKAGSEWFQALNRLSSLRELHLSSCGAAGISKILPWMNLTSLQVLDLSSNSFNSMIPSWFSNLSSLVQLDLSSADFHGQIPELWRISTFKHIDLSMNYNLTANFSQLVGGNWGRMETIRLASNRVSGLLPDSIGNLTSLQELSLFDNNIEGGIPSSIGKICSLKSLILDINNLTFELPKSLEVNGCSADKPLQNLDYFSVSVNEIRGGLPEWLGELTSVTVLDLAYNMITGPIPPSLGNLSQLTQLSLDGNELNGTLPSTLGSLSKLELFGISSNKLTGILNEETFLKLSNLKILFMSSNSFIINVSSIWVPPFQIRNLAASSCQLGPMFPPWFKNQRELQFLDISNTAISGRIPTWFWDLSNNLSLLNMSYNNLSGQIPNPMRIASFADVDLRNNSFFGSIPMPSTQVELLDLSHNQFSGTIPFNFGQLQPYIIHLSLSHNYLSGPIPSSIGDLQLLQIINLSNNLLMDSIPSTLQNCTYLKALVLEHNNLSGHIPQSLGSLLQIQTLHLSNNGLSGLIPQSLQNCISLETLDLGNNQLNGSIPSWLGEKLASLRILRLRSNKFTGQIPFQLSNLQSLQVLDLADNLLSGTIPNIFRGLEAMNSPFKANVDLYYGQYRGTYYEESISIHIKNGQLIYTGTLSLITSIDLSGNSLSGGIPQTLTDLHGLINLNLSENHLTGKIPGNIGGMHQLESLDLSNNHLFGEIPTNMTFIRFLSVLNISNNNLSGEIPPGGQLWTFNPSSFSGNQFLCGPPLDIVCEENDHGAGGISNAGEDSEEEWFYLSVGLGYAVGLLGLVAVALVRKSWGDAYLEFIDWLIEMVMKMCAHGSSPER